jgi:hypothetical protein
MKECKIGDAACLLIDAEGMFQVMLKAFRENGVTMYTPYGTSKKP